MWKVDSSGTAALVRDINPGISSANARPNSSNPNGFTVFNNALYFAANDGTNGRELWKVDSSGTATLVRDINFSFRGSDPREFTVFNNALYFVARGGTDGEELWKVDSLGGVAQVTRGLSFSSGVGTSPPNFTVFNNALYFEANDGTNGRELWKVDSSGTATLVKDINPGIANSAPNSFTVFNDALYFYAGDGITGAELWKVDSSDTVALVRDINPGRDSSNFSFTDLTATFVFNNALYFGADDGTNGRELWKVDSSGTATLVKDINPGAGGSDLRHFTVFNNALYFSTGRELWKVDSSGTAARVSDLNSSSFVDEDFTEFNNALYFQADGGGDIGIELWRLSNDPIPTPTPDPIPTPTPTPTPDPIPTPTPEPSMLPSLARIADDIFSILGGTANKPKLQITISDSSPSSVNELAVFTTDDAQGRIDGIAPTETGYTQAALSRAKVVFSMLANVPQGFDPKSLSRSLEFDSGDNLKFLLIKNDTLDSVRNKNASNPDILFSNASNQKITASSTGSFTLAWEDGNGNSSDFKDFVVNIQATDTPLPLGANLQDRQQGEVLDLSGVDPTKTVQATFTVSREAAYNNSVGLYKVIDSQGTIIDPSTGISLNPEDSGYVEAAIKNRVSGIDLQTANQSTVTTNAVFQGGSIFAPFIIANGSVDQLLDTDESNDPSVYFAYSGANAGGVDHIRLLGNNVFGFEDLPGGGDFDYNDMIIKTDLSVI